MQPTFNHWPPGVRSVWLRGWKREIKIRRREQRWRHTRRQRRKLLTIEQYQRFLEGSTLGEGRYLRLGRPA